MGNFSRSEFACRCGCGFDTVDYALLAALEGLRSHFNAPVYITSGCRCKSHNRAVGGSRGSWHLLGRAADVQVKGVAPEDVAAYCDTLALGGLGRYDTFTHIDTRSGRMARWKG